MSEGTSDLTQRVEVKFTPKQEQKFLDRVVFNDISGACWDWSGATTKDGHPRIEGRHRAARISYTRYVGMLYEDQRVIHTCRNKRCCKPQHLKAVSVAEAARHSAEGRLAGEHHGRSKLTEAQVQAIRQLYKGRNKGPSQALIAQMVGITQTQVSKIVRNECWRHLDGKG